MFKYHGKEYNSKTQAGIDLVIHHKKTIREASKELGITYQSIYMNLPEKFGGGKENRMKQMMAINARRLMKSKKNYSKEEIAKRTGLAIEDVDGRKLQKAKRYRDNVVYKNTTVSSEKKVKATTGTGKKRGRPKKIVTPVTVSEKAIISELPIIPVQDIETTILSDAEIPMDASAMQEAMKDMNV